MKNELQFHDLLYVNEHRTCYHYMTEIGTGFIYDELKAGEGFRLSNLHRNPLPQHLHKLNNKAKKRHKWLSCSNNSTRFLQATTNRLTIIDNQNSASLGAEFFV